ncbi:unnamed protein product (macronuclear) [Paramecium tetraurelia]|uniref:RING-type E3 ubiquitin transferase n=1 Tax=Paramecium tetraurelia TaxID=5888 RepID=A0D8Y9_PARTE|nr:uncharacterized protein GSPATT00014452001 [Paramecium tetraurelia]CAK79506.1 unnamed protein product [Paramecium tetraurelia]|eukprot:XP_001446903.1 hypothetical protein (macronuclear) [Paramecium tetraurelia strain d4-2]
MNNNSNIFRPPSCHKVQTPQFAKEQQQPKNAKGNNRQVFRIQTFKLSPNFKNNLSQMPSTQDTLEQRLADQTSEIRLLQNQIAELKKQNELLEQRLRKANSTVSDYWIKVKDTQTKLQQVSNKFRNSRDKKKMYKRRIIDALNYFYGRYTDAQQQNTPFLQLEELRQILLQLGMHESIVQEMQYLNQQAQNQLNVNIDNMTYEQILNLQERIGNQNVGLTKLQIKEIPKRTKEANDNVEEICTICYDQIQTGNVYRQLPCNHIYHSKCIKAWLLNHKKCPVCNIEVILGSEQHEDHNHQQTQ